MRKRIINILILISVTWVTCSGQQATPSIYRLTKMPFNKGDFSEISPVIVKDGIVFCSDRRFSAIKDRTTFEDRRLYGIYLARQTDTSDFSAPRPLKSERTTLFNNGPLCIAPDGKTVYFTSEIETGKPAKSKKFRNHNGIFIAQLTGETLTGLQPFPYNNPQYDVGQPSISRDGKFLFFASNMPGGQGGTDIYYCEWVNNKWSAPLNLGPNVNSASTDNYPFMHPSGRLYFSSDRPGGLGRLDVYYTSLSYGKWEAPEHMPDPVNSASDDFAFVADDNLQNGYFASNRDRSDDIFKFTSTIIRKVSCDTLIENYYCYQMVEENAVKFDTLPFRYEWKFGDGAKGIGPSVIHCYPGPGSYLVQLDVVNLITKEVLYNEKTYNLEIKDIEQAYISGPQRGGQGQQLSFNADSTNLPGWNINRYYWNFGDETVGIGRIVEKKFMKPGTFNIQLIVTADPDPGGTVRETCVCKNIIITPQP